MGIIGMKQSNAYFQAGAIDIQINDLVQGCGISSVPAIEILRSCMDHSRWNVSRIQKQWPGGRLNKKDGLTRYGNSHVKDKTS